MPPGPRVGTPFDRYRATAEPPPQPDRYRFILQRLGISRETFDSRIAAEVDELLAEMKDRFGEPPPPVLWLYHLTRIRAFASAHHFTLLKFNGVSFFAEQQKGKLIEKKTMLMPKKIQTPIDLETHVIEELRKNFIC